MASLAGIVSTQQHMAMDSLAGIMLTQQHMDHGQSDRHHVNTAAHGTWPVWQASCQHSGTWITVSLAGIMSTQQHMGHGQSGRRYVNTATHGSSLHNTTWTSAVGSSA